MGRQILNESLDSQFLEGVKILHFKKESEHIELIFADFSSVKRHSSFHLLKMRKLIVLLVVLSVVFAFEDVRLGKSPSEHIVQ